MCPQRLPDLPSVLRWPTGHLARRDRRSSRNSVAVALDRFPASRDKVTLLPLPSTVQVHTSPVPPDDNWPSQHSCPWSMADGPDIISLDLLCCHIPGRIVMILDARLSSFGHKPSYVVDRYSNRSGHQAHDIVLIEDAQETYYAWQQVTCSCPRSKCETPTC